MSLLIIGGTGTLGRQIVLQALTKGYKVRCLVRNFRKANFLKEWGVELVYGDLTKPETIPPCLKGITAIIDASTSRPDELDSLKSVDWEGKLYLLEAAKNAKIERFIFFSIQNSEGLSKIPLPKVKYIIEQKIINSTLPYTIFRLTGFYQNLIGQYAIPILENLPIWVTDENMYIAYMDTQDIAIFCLRSLQLPKTTNQLVSLDGLKFWASSEVIKLCEQLAGQSAQVQRIPSALLTVTTKIFGFFEWGQNISDRLSFTQIMSNDKNSLQKFQNEATTKEPAELLTNETYETFKIESSDIIQLEDYFLEYFIRLLKRLRDINFEDVQKQRNLIL